MRSAIDFYLASASPRRRELLAGIGCRFQCLQVDVDESPVRGERPADFVLRLARQKAMAGWRLVESERQLPVLGADTAVLVDDSVLGKPDSQEEALEMLRLLSGRRHRVLTGVAMTNGTGCRETISETIVRFRDLSDSEMLRYWQSGEPRDKAGAYAIQGRGAIFVQHIAGSYSGVVGLPIFETVQLLASFGIDCWREQGQGA